MTKRRAKANITASTNGKNSPDAAPRKLGVERENRATSQGQTADEPAVQTDGMRHGAILDPAVVAAPGKSPSTTSFSNS